MRFSDIGKTVAEFAPMLGGLLGGPAGAGVGSLIASAFGVENKPDAIQAAIKNDPNAAVKLREVELQNKADLERITLETTKVELLDKQQARTIHQHSIMPALIVSVLTVGLIAFITALMLLDIPEANVRLIDTLFGSYLTAWLGSLTYFTGTTRSSADKTHSIRR